MTTPLPDSLVRYGEQLERAIERERLAARRRRSRLALGATAAAVALAAVALSLPVDDATLGPPHVVKASATERAAAVLSAAPGSIVHDVATYRRVGPDGSVSTWREETWRQTSRPYARREVITRAGGAAVETATVGQGPAQLYDAATHTIYTKPPDGGPALGTPMPARDGDPLAAQMAQLLRSGRAHVADRSGGAIRFTYTDPLPGGGAVRWGFVVDAQTYRPVRLSTTSPDGSRVSTRFRTYEALDATPRTRDLLSLRAQHPGATVDRTAAGYQAAQARLYAEPAAR